MTNLIFGTILDVLSIPAAFAQSGGTGGTGGTGYTGGTGGGEITLQNPLGSQSLADIVSAILSALFTLSIPIVSIMVMVGGYYILTAAGNEENLKKGRQAITYAVIGFAVILLANGVVSLIRQLLSI